MYAFQQFGGALRWLNLDSLVSWPSAPLTERLVTKSLDGLSPKPTVVSSPPDAFTKLVQWSTYDAIDHELSHSRSDAVLSSSYIIRKALIRKHYLARCLHAYVTKHPDSVLTRSTPRTWDLEIAFADELDEKWGDELWDLAEELQDPAKWWILKPGMADRGNGIRLFNSKEALERIFIAFDGEDEEEGGMEGAEDTDKADDTGIATSQLRHFVIQEYLRDPLLLDPNQVPLDGTPRTEHLESLRGHKFHLRAYCVASGALEVYLYTRILALFSAVPYEDPRAHPEDDATSEADIDMTPHLTNTCLQTHRGEEGVRLFSELVGCHLLSRGESAGKDSTSPVLTAEHIESVVKQMADILAETFRAALASPVHFQPLPNAFELYGIDFLVTYADASSLDAAVGAPPFYVQLLEINAEPAIEMTGPRLTWILEDLFVAIGKVCVQPFMDRNMDDGRSLLESDVKDGDMWLAGERFGLRKCLDVEVRGSGA